VAVNGILVHIQLHHLDIHGHTAPRPSWPGAVLAGAGAAPRKTVRSVAHRSLRGRAYTITIVLKGIVAWLAGSFALLLGGIAVLITTMNLIGLAMCLAATLSLVGGPFAMVYREGRRYQRAKQDALAEFPESRALDPLRGRRFMGGSPELIREIALRERLEQTGIPGSARILSVTDVSTDTEFPLEVDLMLAVTVSGWPTYEVARHDTVPRLAIGRLSDGRPLSVLVDPAQPDQLVIEWMAQPEQNPAG
jgi:hypothetical protein